LQEEIGDPASRHARSHETIGRSCEPAARGFQAKPLPSASGRRGQWQRAKQG
jgi:hypothetical protein